MHGISAHARFDDLEFDARSQCVGKGKTSALNYFDNVTKQATNIKLAVQRYAFFFFLRDLNFKNVDMA